MRDYRAVLAAINALREVQVDHGKQLIDHGKLLIDHGKRLDRVERTLEEHTRYLRSLDEGQSELKDMILTVLDRLPPTRT